MNSIAHVDPPRPRKTVRRRAKKSYGERPGPVSADGSAPRRAYHPTRAEQETIVRWDREDDQVHIWSASPVTWRKLERLGIVPTRDTYFPGGVVAGRFYRIPLARFRWGLKRVGTGGGQPLGRPLALGTPA